MRSMESHDTSTDLGIRTDGMAGRVLLVDDLDANLKLLSSMLAPEGYQLLTAGGGREALARVADSQPDLVVLDVMMPDVDGFEVCRAIKASRATRLLPVVLVTALQDNQHKLRGLDAGADDFIAKPFNAPEIRARLRSLLRIRRYTDELDERLDEVRAAIPQNHLAPQLVAGELGRSGRLVRTPRGDRIEQIDDSGDLSEQRNGVSAQPVRVTAPVDALVVRADNRSHVSQGPKLAAQPITDDGMQLHLLELLRRERTLFEKQRVGDSDFADVVEVAAAPQSGQAVRPQFHM